VGVGDEPQLSEFDKFKWNILGDAVFEDYQGLWEPLWWLRGGGAIEGQSEVERQRFAERTLRELHDEGLIYFFRVPPPHDINASGEDESLRLTPEEVDETLRGNWWRGTDGVPQDHPGIWFGPTVAGEAACENPPERIRRLWRLDDRPRTLVGPIVVFNRPDGITIYESADALTGHLEPWYVTDEDFDAYDAEGRRVELRLEKRRVPTFFRLLKSDVEHVVPYAIDEKPQHAPALREALLRGFEQSGYWRAEREERPLGDLLAEATEKLDTVPYRKRRR
jgi:hypothetical protein